MAGCSRLLDYLPHKTAAPNSMPEILTPGATSCEAAVAPRAVQPQEGSARDGRTIRGGGCLMARYALGVIIGAGNMLVLTRWIGPHAYGIFVTGIGLVAFLSNLARAGVDTYLVRHPVTPSREAYHAASTLIFVISCGLTLAGAVAAPLLAHWYHSREFLTPYFVMLLSVPVIGLTGVPMARLERDLDFRAVAGIELTGQTLGLAVSAGMAWKHFGARAPVAGQMSWQPYTWAAACSSANLFPRLPYDAALMREMIAFGLGVTSSLRAWQLRTLINPLLVGRLAGVEAVAYVALALR